MENGTSDRRFELLCEVLICCDVGGTATFFKSKESR
jgi:hypothetical protein